MPRPRRPSRVDQQKRYPVHLNFHSGGFCLPFFGADARFCSLLARTAECYVVDVDYRLAPAHPFPAAYEDALAVLDWLRADSSGVFDRERVTVGGFSAGGCLALALAATVENIKGVVALYPCTDFSQPYEDKPHPGKDKLTWEEGTVIRPDQGKMMWSAYLRTLPDMDPQKLRDPRLSPLFADAHQYPAGRKTMIVTCEYDCLRREGQLLAEKLEEAGREPVRVDVKGRGHSWDVMCAEGRDGAKLRDEVWGQACEVVV